MEDLLIETLQQVGIPVMLQGSLVENEPYPERFFTFWERKSSGKSFYDNAEFATEHRYYVNYYSTSPADVYATLRAAIAKLRAAGFIVDGDGYAVASDEPTHDGRGVEVLYLRNNV